MRPIRCRVSVFERFDKQTDFVLFSLWTCGSMPTISITSSVVPTSSRVSMGSVLDVDWWSVVNWKFVSDVYNSNSIPSM